MWSPPGCGTLEDLPVTIIWATRRRKGNRRRAGQILVDRMKNYVWGRRPPNAPRQGVGVLIFANKNGEVGGCQTGGAGSFPRTKEGGFW